MTLNANPDAGLSVLVPAYATVEPVLGGREEDCADRAFEGWNGRAFRDVHIRG
jgi:hypothetical protein